MKLLITGAKGLLGSEFVKFSKANKLEHTFYSSKECDITNEAQLEKIIKRDKPSVLINCAAISNVDLCETEREMALEVNGTAPGLLAKLCVRHDVFPVHFSTDYVFDGENEKPYTEEDPENPVSYYGKTKVTGEKTFLKNIAESYLLIRTSRIFGTGRDNFLSKITDKFLAEKKLRVVDFQKNSPAYAPDIVASVLTLINNNLSGLFHITNSGTCSWFELAEYIKHFLEGTHKLKELGLEKMEYSEFGFKALRPRFSILSNLKYESFTGQKNRSWQERADLYLTEYLRSKK